MSDADIPEAPRRPPAAQPFEARLISTRALSPGVKELVFERTDGRPLDFLPGQWVNVLIPHEGEELKRAYSIASAPNGTNRFELAITRVEGGRASRALHHVEVGDSLRAIGPSGLFTRAASDPGSGLFVGTGTGITPFRSMIRAAIDSGSRAKLWLLLGVRREEDILYRDELEELAARSPSFQLFVTLSRPGPTWTGRRGYVQEHVPELWQGLGDPTGQVFIYGLDRMVKSVRDLARGDLAIGRKQVQQERYD